MISELASFFDDTEAKHKKIWHVLNLSTYQNDHIVHSSPCQRMSRKSSKPKRIAIELGFEHLYLIKNDRPSGQLQLHVVRMELIRTDFGPAIRLTRNQQYVDLICDDHFKLKNLLSLKCLQTTFHDEFGVTKMIGKGSFAKVYLATKKSTNVQYAIKAFNKEFMQEQFKGRESLENEVKVMRRLNQENLVKLHEAYETQNSIYFVLDILKGGELLSRVRQQPISASNLQKLMYNLLKALVHLHQRKCVHRDLKPENLLLKEKENDTDVVIADFGLAAFLNEEVLFKRCGTPGFVAPEILAYKEGDPFYDEKCDVFSAGVIFYVLLTGKQPFQGGDYKAILKANKNCEVSFNSKLIQSQSQALQDLLKKMMTAEPKLRPSSEDCLKHPYFAEIFNKEDLINAQEELANYDKDYLVVVQKKPSVQSQVGSMELQSRSPAMNGNTDTVGSFSQVGGSITKIEHKQQQPAGQSKFSQFCSSMKQQHTGDLSSPAMRQKNPQTDLQKIALKNSLQQQQQQKQQSKDDEYVNEESAHLEDAISKLNAQTPKMGQLKKANSYKVPKSSS